MQGVLSSSEGDDRSADSQPTDRVVDGAGGVGVLRQFCAEIEAMEGPERHANLIALARSKLMSPALMLVDEKPVGPICREAWRALKTDLDAATPQRAWYRADLRKGREGIARILGIVDKHFYSILPFKTMDWQGRTWIGAAVGIEPLLKPRAPDFASHLDLGDIILWDPRSNDVEIAGEHQSATRLILPFEGAMENRLVIYADPGAFFRSWAAHRLQVSDTFLRHKVCLETPDGCMPGAFLLGSLDRVAWSTVRCPTILSGPGVSRKQLARAIYRSANLPNVGEAHGDRA